MQSGSHSPPTDPYALVGTTLAEKYRIDGVLGEGGFGVVYSGSHLVIGARVAIKRMKPLGLSFEDQARANEGFLREAKMLFSLTHPSIVRLYDVGTVTGPSHVGTVPYVVLEYLDGGSLEQEIAGRTAERRHFSLLDFWRVFQPVLEGMAYVHENGIAHRDLKPSNIMLIHPSVRAGTAKVVDFGIARWVADGGRTNTTSLMFTPAYAAPEQWDPALGATGTATDVYALALIMAESLLLSPLRTGMGPAQIFREVLQPRSLHLDTVRPDLPPDLGPVLEYALRVKPEERFSTCGELLAALLAVLPPLESSRPLPDSGAAIPKPTPSALSSASTMWAAPPDSSPSPGFAPPARSAPAPGSAPAHVRSPAGSGSRSADHIRRMTSPHVLTRDDDHLTAVWGPVFLTVWKRVTRPDYARAIQFAVRDLAHTVTNQRVACLTIIEEHAELPNAETRTAVANIFRFNLEHIVCSANVMEGEGFRAAAVRGVVTGIALVARQPFPNHVFSSVAQAARWIAQAFAKEGDHVTASRLSAPDLIDAVAEVRSGILSENRRFVSSDGSR